MYCTYHIDSTLWARKSYQINASTTTSTIYCFSDCQEILWDHVTTDPVLHVPHGTEVLLICPQDFIIGGSSRATCQNGVIMSTNGNIPFCAPLGNG